MNKLFEWKRWMFLEVKLATPPLLRRFLGNFVKDIIELLIRPYLTIYQLQGQTQSGALTVAFAGREYTKARFKHFIFKEEPMQKESGRVPFWSCDKLSDLSSDIIIVEATKFLTRKLSRQYGVVLPRIVDHILNVRGDWQDVQNRFHKTVHKNELRLVRKYGYEYDVSHDREDFEVFYHQMYVPSMDDRHGELSIPLSIGEVYQYFRRGCLLRVTRGGDWVSGVVCHPMRRTLNFDVVGVKNADMQLMRQGASSTLYYAAAHWANRHEYEAVNFLGTRPYLSSGGFQYKRKWGATVSLSPDVRNRFWIRVRRCTPAVSRFLTENPFIVVDKDGKLHGCIVVDDLHNVSAETREKWKKLYVTPGLSSLLIRPVSDLVEGSANINDSNRIIYISERDDNIGND